MLVRNKKDKTFQTQDVKRVAYLWIWCYFQYVSRGNLNQFKIIQFKQEEEAGGLMNRGAAGLIELQLVGDQPVSFRSLANKVSAFK